MEHICLDHLEPSWKSKDLFVVNELHEVFALDALTSSHKISIEVSNPDEITEIFDSSAASQMTIGDFNVGWASSLPFELTKNTAGWKTTPRHGRLEAYPTAGGIRTMPREVDPRGCGGGGSGDRSLSYQSRNRAHGRSSRQSQRPARGCQSAQPPIYRFCRRLVPP